jgi:hypothetical protein
VCRFDRGVGRRHDPADSCDAQLFRISDVVNRFYARVVAVAIAIVLAAVVASRGPAQPYEPLLPEVANLRAQFNADAGKVRMVILPAPT